MILTEKTADKKVERLQSEGVNIVWDGWKLIHYIPNSQGMLKQNGAFYNGEWCIKKTYNVNAQGKWVLPGIHFKKTEQAA